MQLPDLPISPIYQLDIPAILKLDNRLFIKRDDLLPFAFGGNKVRIAHALVEDMYNRGHNALIMYGDRRSNLCRVLSFFCRELRIPSIMIATSEDEGCTRSFNEDMVRRLGVSIMECEKDAIPAAVDEAFELMSSRGLDPYYIYGDRTGRGNEGTCANAYATAYEEICNQERELGLRFDYIFVPYGTGCTQGGLVCGSLLRNDRRNIVGISISSRPRERAVQVLDATVRDWFDKRGLELPVAYEDQLELETSYTCGGYGVRNKRVDNLIEDMLLNHALPLDPTYTGKALRGAIDYICARDIRDANILFVHTGGTPLFYDYILSTRD